jgi:hypothetical protein
MQHPLSSIGQRQPACDHARVTLRAVDRLDFKRQPPVPIQQRQFPFRNRWLDCHQAQIVRANILAFDQAGNFAARRGPSRLALRTEIIEGDTIAGTP